MGWRSVEVLTVNAKIKLDCAKCTLTIQPGEPIELDEFGWVHRLCYMEKFPRRAWLRCDYCRAEMPHQYTNDGLVCGMCGL